MPQSSLHHLPGDYPSFSLASSPTLHVAPGATSLKHTQLLPVPDQINSNPFTGLQSPSQWACQWRSISGGYSACQWRSFSGGYSVCQWRSFSGGYYEPPSGQLSLLSPQMPPSQILVTPGVQSHTASECPLKAARSLAQPK